ncbi:MAG: radical SAM protein [Planctomycetota bacterium]|nr:MAG: radical SAM protein [Planctomycetota bacterium]
MIEQVSDADVCQAGSCSTCCDCDAATDPMEEHRKTMRRFVELYNDLPAKTEATCPLCRKVCPAVFDRHGQQVVLKFDCPTCGDKAPAIVHHDAIWTQTKSDWPKSPTHTHKGVPIRPALRRLPRTVQTLCHDCGAIIVGRYFVQDGAVYIEKSCPEHGYFRDKINDNALIYSKAAWWSFEEQPGHEHPQRPGLAHCPSECGICSQHQSGTVLAQLDLTNRCNMNCPICFANANASGFIFEPSYDEIVKQMEVLRNFKPIPATAIQFSGGEPTIHPDFLKIIAKANELGFSHVQIATNGIRMADLDFARQAAQAGLHTLYLQFDGVGEEAYRDTRNHPGIWQKKLDAIANCREIGMKVCLVPTLIKNITDSQIPAILQFAIDNIDVIGGISWQPVSFTGRMSVDELAKHRYTLGDLAKDLGEIDGIEPLRDFYPIGLITPLSNLMEAIDNKPKIRSSSHTDCACGTYLLVSPTGKIYPFPAVLNVAGLFCEMNDLAFRIKERGRFTWLDKVRLYRMFKRHWNPEGAPGDLTVGKLITTMMGMIDKKSGRGKAGKTNYRTLLCAGMHFQDKHNYDVERSRRCVILYSTPAGVFPFCTHNCGPEYRYLSQASFAKPINKPEPAKPEPAKAM